MRRFMLVAFGVAGLSLALLAQGQGTQAGGQEGRGARVPGDRVVCGPSD